MLDTADRFVNCKCVKYLFRTNEIDKAVETAALFTRVSILVDEFSEMINVLFIV